jgi:hypothetical protein
MRVLTLVSKVKAGTAHGTTLLAPPVLLNGNRIRPRESWSGPAVPYPDEAMIKVLPLAGSAKSASLSLMYCVDFKIPLVPLPLQDA